jgi:hypothetical protein
VKSDDGDDLTLIPTPISQNTVGLLFDRVFTSFLINIPAVFCPAKNISLIHFVFIKLLSPIN